MTKIDFINLCIDAVTRDGLTADNKRAFHPEMIKRYTELGYNQIIHGMWLKADRYADFGQLSNYTVTYPNQYVPSVPVKYDSKRAQYYVDLPVELVQLPVCGGIRSLSAIKDESYQFIYRENTASAVFNETDVAVVDNRPRFSIEHQQIRFDQRTWDEDIAEVLLKMIQPYSAFQDWDQLPFPGGMDLQAVAVVTEIIRGKGRADKSNDNA